MLMLLLITSKAFSIQNMIPLKKYDLIYDSKNSGDLNSTINEALQTLEKLNLRDDDIVWITQHRDAFRKIKKHADDITTIQVPVVLLNGLETMTSVKLLINDLKEGLQKEFYSRYRINYIQYGGQLEN